MAELGDRDVEADTVGAGCAQGDGPLRGTAPQLEHVAIGDVTQDVELALGHAEGTPRDRLPFQLGAMHRLIVVGVCIPEFTIPAYVVVAHDVHLTKRCTVPDSLV